MLPDVVCNSGLRDGIGLTTGCGAVMWVKVLTRAFALDIVRRTVSTCSKNLLCTLKSEAGQCNWNA